MPDISQLTGEVRGLPDQALQQELQQPTGMIPSYLVLAEAQRRQTMRQQAQQQQAQGQSSTVLQDVVRNMMASQPPPGIAPAGMTPPKQGQGPSPTPPAPGQAPIPTPPQGMRRGGRYAEGDLVDEDGSDDDEGAAAPLPSAMQPRLLAPDPITQARVTGRYAPRNLMPTRADINGWIEKYSAKHGVDPDMARAMMARESSGDQSAVSPKGATGLFQLMPGTAEEMHVDPRIPEQNVEGGIKYYRKLLDQFGDPQLALAGYNAGPGAVTHYGGIPPFPETQKYVPAIMARYQQLKAARQQAGPQASADSAAAATALAKPTPGQPPADAAPPPPNAASQVANAPYSGQGSDDPLAALGIDQTALQNVGIGALPIIHPPGQAGPPESGATFAVNNRQPGRIHSNISDLKDQETALQKQLDNLQDPFRPDNMQNVRQNILTAYGLPPNYLESLGNDARKATIRQFQEEAAMRYHNPSPWEFLSNIAAGMGASKSLNVAGAFGEGVGRAWQARDAQQQEAFNEWNNLQKDADSIDAHAETARGRFDTLLNSVLTHQATIGEAQRKLITDQLSKNQAAQNKWQQMLVPTNKFQAMYNREDFGDEAADKAWDLWKKEQKVNPKQAEQELTAIQLLAERGDPYQQGDPQYTSAAEKFTKKYPQEATSILNPPVGDLAKNLINTTYSTNRQFVDGRNMHGKYADQVQQQAVNAGLPFFGKDQAESMDNIEDAQRGFDSMEKAMLNNLPRDPTGHVITANLKIPLNKLTQYDPVLSSWGAWRAQAIAQLRAAAGSKGLRINEAEILSAINNDVPLPSDTVGSAMRKLAIMRRTIMNQEDSLFKTRGKDANGNPTAPAPDLPMLGADKKTLYYVPADQWKKYVDQGYTMLK